MINVLPSSVVLYCSQLSFTIFPICLALSLTEIIRTFNRAAIYPPEHFLQLAGLIPGAKLVVIPDVSHGGTLQDPARFHQAVIGLLDGRRKLN